MIEIAIPQPIPSAMPMPIPNASYSKSGCVLCLDMQDSGNRLIDYSGFGNYGANSGSISVTGYTSPVRSFDGVDDFINCGKSTSIGDLNLISIETWFKRNSLGGGTVGRHLDKVKWILDCPGSQRMSFQRSFSTTNGFWTSPNSSILTGKWNHVVVTYDSSSAANQPIFYVNGILTATSITTAPVGISVSDVNDNLYMGNSIAQNRGFDGQMGLTRLYNRIITSTEAASLYKENAWRYGLLA